MNKRFEELDSLRGLAAVSVLLSHIALILPGRTFFTDGEHTPLHLFWAGHEAVILFFLLSGFVLSLPYLNKKPSSYLTFAVRRVFRIYLPYLVGITVAYMIMSRVSWTRIADLSEWFNGLGAAPLTSKLAIGHLLLIGNFANGSYNPVIWSLIHEMRISLLFPLIVYIIINLRLRTSLLISVLCSSFYLAVMVLANRFFGYADYYNSGYHTTVHYASLFILGGLLAKHQSDLRVFWLSRSRLVKWTFLIGGVLAYTYPRWFFPEVSRLHLTIFNDWATALGAMSFIMIAVSSITVKRILHLQPIRYLGKISYSLYLFHLTVLFVCVHLWYGMVPIW
ncbi:MAG: acyltransferase, partial [Gorillibacterium sp.]|nr:acyltransferase [Gorillibacterium sp.]